MDDKQSKLGGLFKNTDPDLNIPVTGGPAGTILSPFLNYDPRYAAEEADKYIMPEGAGRTRGRFEMAFAQIGTAACIGGAVGGARGLSKGVNESIGLPTSVRFTQVLNGVGKGGASAGQALGVCALIYSIFGVIVSKARGVDDPVNTLTAATATGLLYKAPAGWKSSVRAGAVGMSIAGLYIFLTSRSSVRDHLSKY